MFDSFGDCNRIRIVARLEAVLGYCERESDYLSPQIATVTPVCLSSAEYSLPLPITDLHGNDFLNELGMGLLDCHCGYGPVNDEMLGSL